MAKIDDVPEPSTTDLNDATEAVRNYIDALHEAIYLARCELTLAAASAGSARDEHRAITGRRIAHALDALGGPIAPKVD